MADNRKRLLAFVFDQGRKLLTSSEEANNNDDMGEIFLLFQQTLEKERVPRVRITGYFEETCQMYSQEEFRRHFRMNREVVFLISEILRNCPGIPSPETQQHGGRTPVDVEKQLLITLWYLATVALFE